MSASDNKIQSSNQATGFRWVDTPALVVKTVMQSFAFNCFVYDAISQDRIGPDTFRSEISIEVEDGRGLAFERGRKYTSDELVMFGRSNILMALSTTALATDEAMDTVFGEKNAHDTSELGSVRAIVYQIRNAFAHGPLNPVWKPLPKYKRIYSLTVQVPHAGGAISFRKIEVDLGTLQGKQLSSDDFGGLGGYMGLLQYCRTQVENHPRGHNQYEQLQEC